MTEFVLVEYGDLEGGGFVPHVTGSRPAPPPPFVNAANKLVNGNVPQPPEPSDDAQRYPMWSLRLVAVEDARHWCFAVQGRGGAFGQAGMCQFLFTPSDVHPHDVWHRAVRQVRADGLLGHPDDHPPQDTWVHPPSHGHLAAGLRGLFSGGSTVVLDGEPLDVAATIGALLGVLPVPVTYRHVWSTYLVRRPVQEKRSVVTGQWPDLLPGGNPALRTWLRRAPDTAGRQIVHPKADAVVDWLVDLGTQDGVLPDRYAAQEDLHVLATVVADQELAISRADVPRLLPAGDDRLTKGLGRTLLSEWAREVPVEAARHLTRGLPAEHERIVFESLLEAHLRAVPNANPAYFPPNASIVPGWSDALARLLRGRFAHDQMVEFVRDHLLAPGCPLHDDHARHEQWLASLGVSPSDPANADLYGAPTERIVTEIKATKRLSAINREFLVMASDTVAELRRVLDGLSSLPTKVAADFVALCADEEDVRTVLNHALSLDALRGKKVATEKWLLAVYGEVGAPHRTHVLTAALDQYHAPVWPDTLLALALREAAVHKDLSGPVRRTALLEAASRLEARQRQSSVSPEQVVEFPAASGSRWTERNSTPSTPHTAHLSEPNGAGHHDEGDQRTAVANQPPWVTPEPSPPGRRWFVNLPALLWLLAVMLVLVGVVWVLVQLVDMVR